MSIPPSIGMLLSLVAGIAIGAYGMNARHDSAQFDADQEQVSNDNKKGAKISVETARLIESRAVSDVIVKYKDKVIKVPRDLTNEEIDSLCANRYIPADILQPVRNQITRARERINAVRSKRP